jgi:succinyl-diaminopimelate desuccinylase
MTSQPAHLDITRDIEALTADLINCPSESRHEASLADAVFAELSKLSHLSVQRDGNTVVAQTNLGRAERVVLAGHLDTVPSSGNDTAIIVRAGERAPIADAAGTFDVTEDRMYGLGACDMKGGVAVGLRLAATVAEPTRDVTYIFYDCEEIEANFNGLKRVAETHPEWLRADFAVLMEPSNAGVEGGCQGTMRIEVRTGGRRAHTARGWMGVNAIHGVGEIIERLRTYETRRVMIDELEYREGLQAVFISGGVAGNVVPDECVVTVNHRYAPSRSAAEAEAHLREVFDGFDVTVVDNVAGALPGLSHPAAKAFVEAVGSEPMPKFGWTDVARFSGLGIPAVNFGPGSATLAHAPNEYVPLSHLHTCESALRTWLTS